MLIEEARRELEQIEKPPIVCPECGRRHCRQCSFLYRFASAHVDIRDWHLTADGISHIVTEKGRVLCTGSPVRRATHPLPTG